jgi:hypothetical protein
MDRSTTVPGGWIWVRMKALGIVVMVLNRSKVQYDFHGLRCSEYIWRACFGAIHDGFPV